MSQRKPSRLAPARPAEAPPLVRRRSRFLQIGVPFTAVALVCVSFSPAVAQTLNEPAFFNQAGAKFALTTAIHFNTGNPRQIIIDLPPGRRHSHQPNPQPQGTRQRGLGQRLPTAPKWPAKLVRHADQCAAKNPALAGKTPDSGAATQTARNILFSRVLYQLSYLAAGSDATGSRAATAGSFRPRRDCRGRGAASRGRVRPQTAARSNSSTSAA